MKFFIGREGVKLFWNGERHFFPFTPPADSVEAEDLERALVAHETAYFNWLHSITGRRFTWDTVPAP